ncbi:hypothetical protein ACFWN7_12645 [Agromyces sp. NPDC058484]|uniref:SLAC1 family transporter n=1 Tax=Agromyces sp. NPDC058484 TaxID=3346524 RepID=UPI0036540CEB
MTAAPTRWWRAAVADVPPNAFAFVMASGIVSTALAAVGASTPSLVLLWVAAAGLAVLFASGGIPAGLVILAVPLWIVFAYVLPANLILRPRAAPVSADIDGSWFLLVVSAQSLAIALTSVDLRLGVAASAVAVSLWGIGIVLYFILATLILLRLLTVPNSTDSFTPSYWIFTGARPSPCSPRRTSFDSSRQASCSKRPPRW